MTENNVHEEKEEHQYPLRLPEKLWKEFIETLPLSISANEKITNLIFTYVTDYKNMREKINDRSDNTKNKQ